MKQFCGRKLKQEKAICELCGITSYTGKYCLTCYNNISTYLKTHPFKTTNDAITNIKEMS